MAVQELVLMMALGVCKLLKPLSFMGNPVCNWQEFKEQLTWFIPGTESSEIRIMLTHAGKEVHEIYKTLSWTEPDNKMQGHCSTI